MGSVSGLPGPSDAWITLAGLARDTSTIRLGTMVTSATFRHPGVLAISVANVDAMSNGRVELGLGAGWYVDEHHSNAIPFPDLGERFERLEEQLAILTGMWGTPEGGEFHHSGTHYEIAKSPGLPKPVQASLPIIIGGGGAKKTPALAARYAAEFNLPFQSQARFTEQRDRVRAACDTIGRDPDSLTYGCALVMCVGKDHAEVARRAAAIGREVDELKANGVCGTPAEVVERLREWATFGAERVYLQMLDLADLDHLDLVAAEVMPHTG
jgi:F420-dependent oxidoreductase-like protein